MSGFTIIELLLATAVFSLVLLGALAGFLRTGNLFYKGVSLTQTQATAKQIMDDVSANISNSSVVTAPNQDPSTGYAWYCIGNSRYTYTFNPVGQGAINFSSGGNYGLIKDTVTSCPIPCDTVCNSQESTIDNGTEMLGANMKLDQFLICSTNAASKLYTVNLTVVYDSTGNSNPTSAPPTSCNPAPGTPAYTPPDCTGNTQQQQFCAVSNLTTSVYANLSAGVL